MTVTPRITRVSTQWPGLSTAEAVGRLKSYGPNALPEKKGKPAWLRFLAHFNDVLIYVLLAAAALTAVMGGAETVGMALFLRQYRFDCLLISLLWRAVARRRDIVERQTGLAAFSCPLQRCPDLRPAGRCRAHRGDGPLGRYRHGSFFAPVPLRLFADKPAVARCRPKA
jgi:hypothetical protein